MVTLTRTRTADWISPALLERLTKLMQPIELHRPGLPQHEVLINVGYNKALEALRYALKHKENIVIDVPE